MAFQQVGRILRVPVLVGLLTALCPPWSIGQESSGNEDRPKVPEFHGESSDLFDGKTLGDWKPTEFGTGRSVTVSDGAIELEEGFPLTGVSYAGEVPHDNFALDLEAQRVSGNDFFCAVTFPVGDSHCTLVLGGWGGTVTGLSCLDGKDASENETTQYVRYERNRWYRVRIRVVEQRVEAWLDDRRLVDVDCRGREVSLRNEVLLSRPLGICSFATTARLRNIRLVELDPQRTE